MVLRQLANTDLALSEHTYKLLEDLLMEGDLLEVALDEAQHIWQILKATKRTDDKFPYFDEVIH